MIPVADNSLEQENLRSLVITLGTSGIQQVIKIHGGFSKLIEMTRTLNQEEFQAYLALLQLACVQTK